MIRDLDPGGRKTKMRAAPLGCVFPARGDRPALAAAVPPFE